MVLQCDFEKACYIGYFSHCSDKILNKKLLHGERVYFGLLFEGVQSITTGETWQQELEAAAHIASTARKQREMNAAVHFLLFIRPTTPPHRVVLLKFKVDLPLLNFLKILIDIS